MARTVRAISSPRGSVFRDRDTGLGRSTSAWLLLTFCTEVAVLPGAVAWLDTAGVAVGCGAHRESRVGSMGPIPWEDEGPDRELPPKPHATSPDQHTRPMRAFCWLYHKSNSKCHCPSSKPSNLSVTIRARDSQVQKTRVCTELTNTIPGCLRAFASPFLFCLPDLNINGHTEPCRSIREHPFYGSLPGPSLPFVLLLWSLPSLHLVTIHDRMLVDLCSVAVC